MNKASKISLFTMGALTVFTGFMPIAARADSKQNDKNNMRNLAIAGGVIALYGLTHHDTTATIVGAAGAAYAGSRYEKDRKDQAAEDRRWSYRSWERRDNNRYSHHRNYNR